MKRKTRTLSLIFPWLMYLKKWSSLGVSGFLHPSSRRRCLPFSPSDPSTRSLVARVDNTQSHMLSLDKDENPIERKLLSYILNIQRERQNGQVKAVRAFIDYLGNNPAPMDASDSFIDLLERALTQALRSAGETGDYRLTFQIVETAISYAKGRPILKPRVFGETLGALSQTHANASKIKQIWNLVCSSQVPFLASPLTAFELNVMLKSLSRRNNKARACLDIYRQHADPTLSRESGMVYIRPDAYTSSTLITILTDSIRVDQPREDPKIFEPSNTADASLLEASLRRLSYSPCWQWNAVVETLSTLQCDSQWNNFAYGALLKLQDRAQELIRGHENGPQLVLAIFDSLMKKSIQPDIVTCTLVIKGMVDPHADPESWRIAVNFLDKLKTDPLLPDPNEYSYSAAIVACARCQEYTTALNLLKEMRSGRVNDSSFVPPAPNTWIYNAVLSAIVSQVDDRRWSKGRSPRSEDGCIELALTLLQQMKDDHRLLGLETRPDTVTYNTILAMKGLSARSGLIHEMKEEQIERDTISYRNAVAGSTDSGAILALLKEANIDLTRRSTASIGGTSSKCGHDILAIYNTALSTPALLNDFRAFTVALQLLVDQRIQTDQATLSIVIKVLSINGKLQVLLDILRTLHDKELSHQMKSEKVAAALGITTFHIPSTDVDADQYVSAIESSLVTGRLEEARCILSLMREHEVEPTSECLQSFALAYAQSAIRTAGRRLASKNNDILPGAASKADNAYKIATALKDLSPKVLSVVAQACAKTQQWSSSRAMLRTIHRQMLGTGIPLRQREVNWVRGVHSTLIRECALQSNITAALEYASDIQNFGLLSRGSSDEKSSKVDFDIAETDTISSLLELQKHDAYSSYVGMRAADWVALIKCASSAGHWKVCVNTLQFLKPHVLRTNPKKFRGVDGAILDSRHEQLVPALIATCMCLEKRSQYAWGERVISEWMKWSGRQPRPEAVLATVRNLSERGRGDEVKALLTKCIYPKKPNAGKYTRDGVGYEEMIYIGAITSLHNNGMYDDADEVFVSAISQGYLPFVFGEQSEENMFVLDLHGANVALAHSAVRIAMRRLANEKNEDIAPRVDPDMMIITGRGRNSATWMRPVIRPEVQRMLLEEFYPPLNTISVPGNTGALMVYNNDISAWQTHQQEQKGVRMLTLALLLKNASTDRIQKIVTRLGNVDPQQKP